MDHATLTLKYSLHIGDPNKEIVIEGVVPIFIPNLGVNNRYQSA